MSDHTIVVIWVMKIFLYRSSVYSCHLFLISSASVRSISIHYCDHLCMKYSLGISNFLEEISSLSHSIVFRFFALITEEVFLISPCYSLELCVQMDIGMKRDCRGKSTKIWRSDRRSLQSSRQERMMVWSGFWHWQGRKTGTDL